MNEYEDVLQMLCRINRISFGSTNMDAKLIGFKGRSLEFQQPQQPSFSHEVPYFVTRVRNMRDEGVVLQCDGSDNPDAASVMGCALLFGIKLANVQVAIIHFARNLFVRGMRELGFDQDVGGLFDVAAKVRQAKKLFDNGWIGAKLGVPYLPADTFRAALNEFGIDADNGADLVCKHRAEVLRLDKWFDAWSRWPKDVDKLNKEAEVDALVDASIRALQREHPKTGLGLLAVLCACAQTVADNLGLQKELRAVQTPRQEVTHAGSVGPEYVGDGKNATSTENVEAWKRHYGTTAPVQNSNGNIKRDASSSGWVRVGGEDFPLIGFNDQYVDTPPLIKRVKECTCGLNDLMVRGCKCGASTQG